MLHTKACKDFCTIIGRATKCKLSLFKCYKNYVEVGHCKLMVGQNATTGCAECNLDELVVAESSRRRVINSTLYKFCPENGA